MKKKEVVILLCSMEIIQDSFCYPQRRAKERVESFFLRPLFCETLCVVLQLLFPHCVVADLVMRVQNSDNEKSTQ